MPLGYSPEVSEYSESECSMSMSGQNPPPYSVEGGDNGGFRSQGPLNSLDELDKRTMIYILSFSNAESIPRSRLWIAL